MIASGSSTLIVGPGPNPYYGHIERIDGGDFQLSSVVFSAAANGIAVIGQIPFGAHLFIDGYRNGVLLYHFQTPLSAFGSDNSEVPLVYAFDELVNVDLVKFYTSFVLQQRNIHDRQSGIQPGCRSARAGSQRSGAFALYRGAACARVDRTRLATV